MDQTVACVCLSNLAVSYGISIKCVCFRDCLGWLNFILQKLCHHACTYPDLKFALNSLLFSLSLPSIVFLAIAPIVLTTLRMHFHSANMSLGKIQLSQV